MTESVGNSNFIEFFLGFEILLFVSVVKIMVLEDTWGCRLFMLF